MYGRPNAQNAGKFGDTANHDGMPRWSDRRVQAFLSTRTPERWLMGLLGFALSLLVLIRLNPDLLNVIFG